MFSMTAPRLACWREEPMDMFAEAISVSDTKLPFKLPTAVPMFRSLKSSWRGETVPVSVPPALARCTSVLLEWYFLMISSARMF